MYRVGKLDVFFGSYPRENQDMDMLKQHNIKAVISLLTETEMNYLGIKWDDFLQDIMKRDIFIAKHF